MAALKSVESASDSLARVRMVAKTFRKREFLSMQLAIDNEAAQSLKVIHPGRWSEGLCKSLSAILENYPAMASLLREVLKNRKGGAWDKPRSQWRIPYLGVQLTNNGSAIEMLRSIETFILKQLKLCMVNLGILARLRWLELSSWPESAFDTVNFAFSGNALHAVRARRYPVFPSDFPPALAKEAGSE